MHTKGGDTVYYITEIFVVNSNKQAGVFCNEGEHSQAQKLLVAEALHPMLLVEMADISEAGLTIDRKQNVALLNERSRLVYQMEAFQQELSSLQRKAEVTMIQLQLRRTRPFSASCTRPAH